ncbi:MAG: hypothetical protein WBQ24_13770 [Xanthobacteraceae bacterium]
MAESPDHADGEKVEPINNNASDSSATPETAEDAGAASGDDLHAGGLHKNLPMVLSPKLGAGEDETVEERAAKPEEETPAAAASPTHSSRFMQLAATIAFIAAFSSFVGSVSGAGFAHFYYPTMPAAESVQVSAGTTLQQLKGEFAALKAEVDSTMRGTNGQYSKIADRLDRLDQHFASAADMTGSIASSTAAESTQPKINDRILQNWAVRDVQNGRALVESRFGGIFDVGAGSVLPGVGRVDSIKRQDGQWLVLTARGTITSGH